MVYIKKQLVRTVLIALFGTAGHQLYAQEGFGTAQPNKAAVIDLTSESKGLLIPRVALSSLTSFMPIKGLAAGQEHTANSLFVYNVASAPLAGITPGYYYWSKPGAADAGQWIRMTDSTPGSAALPKFFYMPSIVIPTAEGQIPATYPSGSVTFAAGSGRIELHTIYSAQFTGVAGSSTRNPGAGAGLPVLPAGELNYHITWYDNTVFTNVMVSNAGVLTYEVIAGANIDEASFMNIIFEIN